jgi:hypothetical protein
MDFIERIFGVAPDAGSGLYELSLLLAATAGLILLRGRWLWRRPR